MRNLKDLGEKYFICTGNKYCLYKKINDEIFISYYSDEHTIEYNDSFYFENYPHTKIKYLKYSEYQSVMKKNILIMDLWDKYFGN